VYSHVDVAIAVGTNNRNYFRWCGVRHDRIALAPHSIDTVRFANDAAQHEQQAACWRRELGIDASTIVFLFAGKLQHKKNPCLLLDAFLSLETDSHLIFVGSGELEDQLRSKSVGNDRVHFMSFQNQRVMPAVYRLGDVFVLPSQGPEETWGLALNEAMASGRAVIASDKVGGACDLIETGKTGWMFASGDAGALTNLLGLSLALGKTVLHSMGCAAQATTSRWSTEESARLIAEAVLACTASP
jgi:glycosyltransferase involved in cell wall biosynthesis